MFYLFWDRPVTAADLISSSVPSSAMSTIVRKKRNFKGLGLDVSQPPLSPQPEPIPTRLAPAAGGGKRKPPPMVLKKDEPGGSATTDADGKLTVTVTPTSAPSSASRASGLQDQIGEMGQPKYDLKNEDLREIGELGQGNGGSVKKVEHTPTNTIMAKKASRNKSVLNGNAQLPPVL